MSDDDELPGDSPWRLGKVVLDDMQVSQDAADFLAIHGTDSVELWTELKSIFTNMPPGRIDLMLHWEAVADRIQEMAAAQQKPRN
jgi:hypothetical protein